MNKDRSTRGSGVLEPWLAQQRYRHARRALATYAPHAQNILDIGCGTAPLFLRSLAIMQRCGIDKLVTDTGGDDAIQLRPWDALRESALPFPAHSFDVITMLAVWEHVARPQLDVVCGEIYRCLRHGGCFILTTPSPLAQCLLVPMAWCGAVSQEEINEHVSVMGMRSIRRILRATGFNDCIIGYRFLCGLNQLVVAKKVIPTKI